MYLGQSSFDLPLTTVSQDPLSTLQSNIPGLVMTAPEVLVGQTPAMNPLLLVAAIAILYFLSKGK